MTGTQEVLRAQVRAALIQAEISQAEACRQLGVSTKYMSQMLTGRSTLTLAWAERIVGLCGGQIHIGVQLRGRAMTEPRLTASNITDPALTDLYDRLEAAFAQGGGTEREATLTERDSEPIAAEKQFAEAAIARVRKLHRPVRGLGYRTDGSYGEVTTACTACGTTHEYAVPWPCDTIRALNQPKDP